MEPVDIYRHAGVFAPLVKALFAIPRRRILYAKLINKVRPKDPAFPKYDYDTGELLIWKVSSIGRWFYDSTKRGSKYFHMSVRIHLLTTYGYGRQKYEMSSSAGREPLQKARHWSYGTDVQWPVGGWQ